MVKIPMMVQAELHTTPFYLEGTIQLSTSNELLDLILELDAFLHIMAMVTMIKIVLIWIT